MKADPEHVFVSQSGTKFYDGMPAARVSAEDDAVRFSHLEWESYAWPGGYPIYYVTDDGGVLCPACANKEIMRTIDPEDRQFFILAGDINYENEDLWCDHCNKQIESAYGDEQTTNQPE